MLMILVEYNFCNRYILFESEMDSLQCFNQGAYVPLNPMQILLNNQLSYIEDTCFSMNSIFMLFVDCCEFKWL